METSEKLLLHKDSLYIYYAWKINDINHLINDTLTKEYFIWKNKLMNNKYPIEYPMGISNKNKYHYIVFKSFHITFMICSFVMNTTCLYNPSVYI